MVRVIVMWAAALVATGVQAAAPPESFQTRLEAVDAAGREILADGMTWALSSTVAISMPGIKRPALRDLKPGMHVRLVIAPSSGAVPVVNRLTVLPD